MSSKFIKAVKNAIDAFEDTFSVKAVPTENPPSTQDVASMITQDIASKDVSPTDTPPIDDKKVLPPDGDEPVTPKKVESTEDELKNELEESEPALKPQLDVDNPETRLKTFVELPSGGYALGFSIQGRSHILTGVPCQDYHTIEDLGDGWLLSVVSDGAGSAREAARGSKANCELATNLIKKLLEGKGWKQSNYFPTDKEWFVEIRNIFEVMQAIITRSAASQVDSYKKEQEKSLLELEEKCQKASDNAKWELQKNIKDLKESMENPLEPRDFNATIVLLLISPQGMMAAHIGDGRMGYLSKDGKWKSLMTPHKGEEASSTVFIPNNWNRQLKVPSFTMSDVFLPETCVINERPRAFVLMSDGCESFSWSCKVFDKERNRYYDRNEPFERFLNPLIAQLGTVANKEDRIAEMIDIVNVGTVGGKKELDDRTMLLGMME